MLLKTTCWQNWTCRGWSNVPRRPFASCDVMEYLFCIDFRDRPSRDPNPEMRASCTIRALPDERERRNHETT